MRQVLVIPLYSSLIAITGMCGNRRRTIDNNSNPLMFGIRK